MSRLILFFCALLGSASVVIAQEPSQTTAEAVQNDSTLSTTPKLLTPQEKPVYAMLISVMDIINTRMAADPDFCVDYVGSYRMKIYATGVAGQRRQNNMVKVDFKGHPIAVVAIIGSELPELGTRISTRYVFATYDGLPYSGNMVDPVSNIASESYFDPVGNLQQSRTSVVLTSPNTDLISYTVETLAHLQSNINSEVIENQYSSIVNGWGMSWLTYNEHPVTQYWQRYWSSLSTNQKARTFMVRDIMEYNKICRVQMDIFGKNDLDFASQEGYLSIQIVPRGYPVSVNFE